MCVFASNETTTCIQAFTRDRKRNKTRCLQQMQVMIGCLYNQTQKLALYIQEEFHHKLQFFKCLEEFHGHIMCTYTMSYFSLSSYEMFNKMNISSNRTM
uniref:Uncharacterized protein n=1 Tax=Octopus bimaculoides TaxID=37653 RepID=A0A0L8HY28_OCTBM